MSDPISFTSASPRYSLPFLFSGQAQKEFFVNEAHAITDMLLHPAIMGEGDTPPAAPVEGECWLVGSQPTAAWSDHAGDLASLQSGNWVFVPPRNGMRVYDEASNQELFYLNGWQAAAGVAAPDAGNVIDVEARTAINGLIAALVSSGVLQTS